MSPDKPAKMAMEAAHLQVEINLQSLDFHWFSIATSWVLSRSMQIPGSGFDPGILPESLDAQWPVAFGESPQKVYVYNIDNIHF